MKPIRLMRLCALLICIFNHISLQAQNQEILIGKTMPEVALGSVLNYTHPQAKLSDFRGKLVILDFWASYCAPCIAMFAQTDSLEKAFKGKLQFIAITKEPREKVLRFFEHRNAIKHQQANQANAVPITLTNDTLFSAYFHYATIPYYVWINPDGKVIATTGAQELTAANIAAVLAGKALPFESRKDIRFKPLNIPVLLLVSAPTLASKMPVPIISHYPILRYCLTR